MTELVLRTADRPADQYRPTAASTIPTLLGNDGTTAGNYTNDHPVGLNATISVRQPAWSWANNGTFTVTAGQPVCPVRRQLRLAGSGAWKVVATLRHQRRRQALRALHHLPQPARDDRLHLLVPTSPIAGDGGGKYYATYFFVNGPYNPNLRSYASTHAPSTTQFCRQCHFGEANEANNTNNITTVFQ